MEKQSDQAHDTLQSFISDGTPCAIIERYASLPQMAADSDYGELDRNIVVLDTETTGFSFNHDELTQIAAARMEGGAIVDWFITFVNPGKPIPEEVAHLTNIHDEDVAGAPEPSVALEKLVAFVGDAKIVAHNADFDRTFTTRHPSGYPLLENIWIDSLDLARIALPRLKSHRLLDIARAFGAPLSTHRADDDVAATCASFRILLAAVDAMPPQLVCEIASMATSEQWPTRTVFEYFARRHNDSAGNEGDSNDVSRETSLMDAADDRDGENDRDVSRETSALRAADDVAIGDGVVAACGAAANDDSTTADDIAVPSAASSDGELPDSSALKAASSNAASASSRKRFSLRVLRSDRLGKAVSKAKADADAIAADPLRELRFPSEEDIVRAFSDQGLVGALYQDFEPRVEQVDMAKAVRSAFAASENLVVEAGTGVGKSMAYLVPAALAARENNISVGVATKTNALLDQLVYRELPALGKALAQMDPAAPALTFAPLKGFSHYPCLRRIDRLVSDGPQVKAVGTKEQSQAPALAALLSYVEQTEYDDMDGLKIDYRLLPRYSITTTSHDCLRRKCPYFGAACFVHGARRRAESADIVVTNHSLLFCDLVADGGLLPPIRYWVIDEAHGAETEARRAFSLTIAAEDILRLVHRVDSDEASRNVFVRAERRGAASASEEGSTLLYGLAAKARAAGKVYAQAATEFAAHMKDLLFFDASRKGRGYEYVELWINDDIRRSETFARLASFAKVMTDAAEKLVTACQELVGYLEGMDGMAEVQREIASTAMMLKDMLHAAEVIFEAAPETYAYSATLCKKNDRAVEKLEALLVNVGEKLGETLFDHTHSTVLASATLAVDGSFSSFENALGLNKDENSRARTCQLDSSYDFDNHMVIYVVSDIPEPNDPSYLAVLQQLLITVHRAQQGSMLTLFTNRREMEKCFEAVQPALKADDLRLVCQKWGVSVKGLRDDFLADEHLSLFALKSFWEGFDAPGATLKGVVIPKLPFAKPTDPLSCERAARDDQAWRHYVLPQAVLETKQAAGRLIRKADDTGVLILADRRLITKSYGKAFLNSMPSRTIKVRTTAEIAAALSAMR